MNKMAVTLEGEPTAPETYRKITWRLIPFLFICYVFAYLDRINIGIAQLDMKHDVGFSDMTYSIGAGIFFVGYVLMEVPSNLLLARVGVRKTFARIMVVWGILAALTAFVTTPMQLYSVRFLLGLAEAGLWPGIVFYLTLWYPVERRAKVLSILVCATGVAGVVGGPLSGWLMSYFDGSHGLHGWQWMFVIQGLPSCVLGVMAYFYLDENPGQAKWLEPQEKALIAQEIRGGHGGDRDAPSTGHALGRMARDPKVYVLAFIWFAQIAGIFAVGFWLPSIIKESGVEGRVTIGLYSAVPYLVSWIFLLLLGSHSDRTMERRWHCAITMFIGAIGLLGAGLIHGSPALSLFALSLAAAGAISPNPLIWAIVTDYIRGPAAAGGIALVNCIGLLGGIASPMIIGSIKTMTSSMSRVGRDSGNFCRNAIKQLIFMDIIKYPNLFS